MRLGAELDATAYGGKAAHLSMALRAGLPVPEGFALTWEEVDVIATGVPGGEEALSADLVDLADVPPAVRSSAVGEDSRRASFAGQHLTVLNVVGDDAVLAAIQRVWQSGRDEAALAYRRRMGIAGDPRIGVVVQRMVAPDVAGVLFTCDPVSGTPDRWVIEASWGLGEAAVAGLVCPDLYIARPSGDLLEARQGTKKGRGDARCRRRHEPTRHRARGLVSRRGRRPGSDGPGRSMRAALRPGAGHRMGLLGRETVAAAVAAYHDLK
jgi:pyruvate,water dikinase